MEHKTKYCPFCVKRDCLKSCHGKGFDLMPEYVKRDGFNPTEGAFIPKNSEEAFYYLINSSSKLRRISPEDANKSRVLGAIVEYEGTGARETFKAWGLYVLDIGQVGKVFADVYIQACLYYFAPCGSKRESLHGALRAAVYGKRLFLAVTNSVSSLTRKA
jgi:hypothetical protein